jgi:hypothetical protein
MKTARGIELEGAERLLILLLLKLGTPSKEIGLALDVDSSLIRKTFPVKKKLRSSKESDNPEGSNLSPPDGMPLIHGTGRCSGDLFIPIRRSRVRRITDAVTTD